LYTPIDAKAIDVDGDGRLDLVITSATASDISVYAGRGNGTFADPISFGHVTGRTWVDDFDGDGRPDILADSERATVLMLNRSTSSERRRAVRP
jgi:hypothetical protein